MLVPPSTGAQEPSQPALPSFFCAWLELQKFIASKKKKNSPYTPFPLLCPNTRERKHPPLHLLPTFLLFLLQIKICQLPSTTVPVPALTHQLSTLWFLRCCCLCPHYSFPTLTDQPFVSQRGASLANRSSTWCSQEGREALTWAHAEAAFPQLLEG